MFENEAKCYEIRRECQMKLTFHNWIDTVVWRLLACRNPRPWNSHPARVREESLGLSSAIQEHRCQYYCCSVSQNLWSRRLDRYRGLKGKHEHFMKVISTASTTRGDWITAREFPLCSCKHRQRRKQSNKPTFSCFHFCREKAFSSRLISTSRVMVGLK